MAGCYERHANAYVSKPSDFEEFMRVVRQIGEFWGRTAQRPPRPVDAN